MESGVHREGCRHYNGSSPSAYNDRLRPNASTWRGKRGGAATGATEDQRRDRELEEAKALMKGFSGTRIWRHLVLKAVDIDGYVDFPLESVSSHSSLSEVRISFDWRPRKKRKH